MRDSKPTVCRTAPAGFTLVELLVVLAIIVIVAALFLPAVRSSKEAARRMSCGNNLKQLGLALHNYHDTHSHFPAAMGGTLGGTSDRDSNAGRLSGLVAMLPFLEQPGLWQQLQQPSEHDGVTYPAMGPAPWVAEYPVWSRQLSTLACASAAPQSSGLGRTNYAFSIGDLAVQIHDPGVLRGAFACGQTSRLDDIADGASYTLAMAEIGTRDGRAVQGQFAVNQSNQILKDPSACFATSADEHYASQQPLSDDGRGGRWADGAAGYGLVQTILPPNSPSCAVGGIEAVDGIYSAGSYHPGGSQIVKLDGAVSFITADVDTGQTSAAPLSPQRLQAGPVPSPYGIWGALGTAAGEETSAD
ncbi:DUF1559 domain-containing protein [Roseimaritima ulvae]|uniref:DUF1559 domain-containing protein n=1 Tax=Roseimaritima ulvae TaxID=980254 RepID=A0A5B9QRE9_9BACT|nr:DUF1559 domain-containing protein [Roseimaritima ulvae]QEG41677.1 hypothetical protein UC8_37030 [Roseimaritima ulvae]